MQVQSVCRHEGEEVKHQSVDHNKGTHKGSKPVANADSGWQSTDYYRDLLSPETREKLEKRNEMRKDQSRA